MDLVKRQPGDRRWGMAMEFPLTDFLGNRVIDDRRSGSQRRRSTVTLDDLAILFSQVFSNENTQK
jgi:hypothetical protein